MKDISTLMCDDAEELPAIGDRIKLSIETVCGWYPPDDVPAIGVVVAVDETSRRVEISVVRPKDFEDETPEETRRRVWTTRIAGAEQRS